jgi:uncharacterized protein involved in type VI secretion and phage assembly
MTAGALPGIALGTVTDVKDPQGLGRVRVRFSLTGQQTVTDWVQVMSYFAGPDYGAFFPPQVNDSALLAFANGDPSAPYVLGFVWNGTQKPPVPGPRQQEVRQLKTRRGKSIVFDDSGQGKLTIVDEKNNRVVIDTANNRIEIASQGDLTISAKGKLTISAAQVVVQNTAGSVKADLSSTSMQLNGAQNLVLKAAMIDLN